MATLGDFPNGIPREEYEQYRCRVCDSPIAPESRIYDGFGWAHFMCAEDFTDPALRNERP